MSEDHPVSSLEATWWDKERRLWSQTADQMPALSHVLPAHSRHFTIPSCLLPFPILLCISFLAPSLPFFNKYVATNFMPDIVLVLEIAIVNKIGEDLSVMKLRF